MVVVWGLIYINGGALVIASWGKLCSSPVLSDDEHGFECGVAPYDIGPVALDMGFGRVAQSLELGWMWLGLVWLQWHV